MKPILDTGTVRVHDESRPARVHADEVRYQREDGMWALAPADVAATFKAGVAS